MIGKDIDRAANYLKRGEVVAIPTETVYGLAGNAFDVGAVRRIYKMKRRPLGDPLIVHASSVREVMRLVTDFPLPAQRLARCFWPGPLTLLLRKRMCVPRLVTAALPRVGVRVPGHPMVLSLLKRLDFPLAAPSANPFGYMSPTTAQHVADQLGGDVPYILDGGACVRGLESTIVGFEDGQARVYRLGSLTLEQLEGVMGAVLYDDSVVKGRGHLRVPGAVGRHHYAPFTRLYVGDLATLCQRYADKRMGVLLFGKEVPPRPVYARYVLSAKGCLLEAGRRLFMGLRYLDGLGCDVLLAPWMPEEGLGKTINERLMRASQRRGSHH